MDTQTLDLRNYGDGDTGSGLLPSMFVKMIQEVGNRTEETLIANLVLLSKEDMDQQITYPISEVGRLLHEHYLNPTNRPTTIKGLHLVPINGIPEGVLYVMAGEGLVDLSFTMRVLFTPIGMPK